MLSTCCLKPLQACYHKDVDASLVAFHAGAVDVYLYIIYKECERQSLNDVSFVNNFFCLNFVNDYIVNTLYIL